MSWVFDPLAPYSYDVIVADAPWLYELRSDAGAEKSPQAHYKCMPTTEIAALPVDELVRPNCWLLLWATAPMLPDQLFVMRSWGFEYKTHIVWRKTTKNDKQATGPGFIARTQHEIVLIGSIGDPGVRKPFDSIFDGERRQHSRKPDGFMEQVRANLYGTRRANLFTRETVEGFDGWGDQATLLDEEDS